MRIARSIDVARMWGDDCLLDLLHVEAGDPVRASEWPPDAARAAETAAAAIDAGDVARIEVGVGDGTWVVASPGIEPVPPLPPVAVEPSGHVWIGASAAAHAWLALMAILLPPSSPSLALDLFEIDHRTIVCLLGAPEAREAPRVAHVVAAPVETAAPEPGSGENEGAARGDLPSRRRGRGRAGRRRPSSSHGPVAEGCPEAAEIVPSADSGLLSALGTPEPFEGPEWDGLPLGPPGDPLEALGGLGMGEGGGGTSFGAIPLGSFGSFDGGETVSSPCSHHAGLLAGIHGIAERAGDRDREVVSSTAGGSVRRPAGASGGGALSVRIEESVVYGSMPRELVRRIVRRHHGDVVACYAAAPAPRPSGRVEVAFVIGVTGDVSNAAIAQTTLGDATVETCVVRAIRRWAFPVSDGGGVVGVRQAFVFMP